MRSVACWTDDIKLEGGAGCEEGGVGEPGVEVEEGGTRELVVWRSVEEDEGGAREQQLCGGPLSPVSRDRCHSWPGLLQER